MHHKLKGQEVMLGNSGASRCFKHAQLKANSSLNSSLNLALNCELEPPNQEVEVKVEVTASYMEKVSSNCGRVKV